MQSSIIKTMDTVKWPDEDKIYEKVLRESQMNFYKPNNGTEETKEEEKVEEENLDESREYDEEDEDDESSSDLPSDFELDLDLGYEAIVTLDELENRFKQ